MKRNLRKNINMNINISTKTIRRTESYQSNQKKKKNLPKTKLLEKNLPRKNPLKKNLLNKRRLMSQRRIKNLVTGMKILTTGDKLH